MTSGVWSQFRQRLQEAREPQGLGDLAREIDPRTLQTPALNLIDKELMHLANTRGGRLIISVPPQEGKLLADDTPVPTPDGWKNHGELKPGDHVFSPSGKAIRVTEVHKPGMATLEVHLDGQEVILAHPRHEWKVFDHKLHHWRVLETAEMMSGSLLTSGRVKGRNRFSLPSHDPIQTPESNLFIDPHSLGLWVADGGAIYTSKSGRTKHIPTSYLRASVAQRRALLNGLVPNGGHRFSNRDAEVVEDVAELVRSLGYRAHTYENSGMHSVAFSRGLTGPSGNVSDDRHHLFITNITFAATPKPGRCITVDSPDGLYLAGKSFTPTHNSSRAARVFPIWLLKRNPNMRVVIASYGQGLAQKHGRYIRNAIRDNPQLGVMIKHGSASVSDWGVDGAEGGVLSVGIGTGLTGNPADCVTGDTILQSSRGSISAREAHQIISVGGALHILAFDHKANSIGWGRIEASREILRDGLIEIKVNNGASLTCTSDHAVFSGGNYVPASWLQRGDALAVSEPGLGQSFTLTGVTSVENAPGSSLVYDFQVSKYENFFANGILVHNCLIIDDPMKDRKEADSPVFRNDVWEWWTDTASTRLGPGAPVCLILTRWHEDDLAGRLLSGEDKHRWRVVNIPAQSFSEDDPLGRPIGEYLVSARGRTRAEWEAIKKRVGPRTWASLYQGQPAPPGGAILKRNKLQFYNTKLWIVRQDGAHIVPDFDEMLISVDCAFKDLSTSDFVSIQVWMRRGPNCFLLDQDLGRYDFNVTCEQIRAMVSKWPQALLKLVEDKANGPAVIASLSKLIPGIVPEIPNGSKSARVHAISPLFEAGNIWLPAPEIYAWISDYIEEITSFPSAANDDQMDATAQALNRLVLVPLMNENTVFEEDDDDDRDFSISPF